MLLFTSFTTPTHRALIALLSFTLLLIGSSAKADLLSRAEFSQAIAAKSYKAKPQLITQIAQHNALIAQPLLSAWLQRQLYISKADGQVIRFDKDSQLMAVLALDLSLQNSNQKFDLSAYKKAKINNKLRGLIRQQLALINLSASDSDTRIKAIKAIIKKFDASNTVVLSAIAKQEKTETNASAKALQQQALALAELGNTDKNTVLVAINTLASSLEPSVLNHLQSQFEQAQDLQADSEIINAYAKAIKKIEGKQGFYANVETLYFGLSLGSVLILAGIGLAITFGVMGVINMAHGELIMLGAYTTYVVQQLMPEFIGLSIFVAIPAAFIVSAIVGILMERLVIRHLYGRPLETLLATFGISLILQQAVRSIFSPLNRTVITPDWMSGLLEINSLFSLTLNRLYIIIFCFIVFFALLMLMKRSVLGLQVKAVSQNRNMARAMGVHSQKVDILTFGLGSGIAGVAGVALSLLTNVGPNLGQAYIIDSFIVVVFGGVGNLFGTLFAGLSLGISNKLLEPVAGAVLAKIILLIFIILFIQKRPQGLFPQRGRAAEA